MAYDKLLTAVVKDLKEAKEVAKGKSISLGRGCKHYEDGCRQALVNYAENGTECGNHCEYCRKFRWAIDRAKHYGEKLGIPWKEIIQSWDSDRRYWYMNYYQECNQPKIDSDNVFVFESVEEMRKKVGTEFVCPCCKEVSTDPYECNSGKTLSNGKKCDWKAYGLLQFDLAFIYCKAERKSTKCFMPKALVGKEQECTK